MAYFHINDPDQTSTYQICTFSEPYISGLELGHVLVHLEPAFMQKDNGLLVGIDHRFTDFYVINQDRLVIKKMKIEWRDCISSSSTPVQTVFKTDNVKVPEFWLYFIFVFLIMIMIKRVTRCKRY